MRCGWCRTKLWNGHWWHLNTCPRMTGVYPAVDGQRCHECAASMDCFVYTTEDSTAVCICLGCAAVKALV